MATTEETVKRFQTLKAKRDALEKKRMECSVRLESLRDEYRRIIEKMRNDFGVGNIEEAVSLRDRMQKEVEEKCEELEKRLDAFEKATLECSK